MPDSTIGNMARLTNPTVDDDTVAVDAGVNKKLSIEDLFKLLESRFFMQNSTDPVHTGFHGELYNRFHMFSGNVLMTGNYCLKLGAGTTGLINKIVAGNFSTNAAVSDYTSVTAGTNNTASGSNSIVGGGVGNRTNGAGNMIGAGNQNTSHSTYTFVGAGQSNLASGNFAAVVARHNSS